MRSLLSRRPLGLATAGIGALLLALVIPTATGTSRALAQGVSSADISPTQGIPGSLVSATGSGWTPGDEIQAIWNGISGPDVGSPVLVNTNGDFSLSFTVPSGATVGDSYQVAFWDENEQYFEVANEEFTVTSKVPVPAAPTNVKVVPYGPLDFFITWSDSSNTLEQPDFQVYNGVTTVNITNSPPYQDLWAVANPGTYDCFAVRAYNSSGYSPWAGMWTCATTPPGGIPAAPTNVIATGDSTTSIKISFVNQANNETAFLFYNGVSTRTYSYYVEPGKGSSFAVDWTGLQPHTWMCFKVAAYNQWGTSAYIPSSWACAYSKS